MDSPAAGEVEALISNDFILDIKGLDRWPDLKKLANFQKQLIRRVVCFQANGKDSSLLFITTEDEVYGVGNNSEHVNILGLTGEFFQCDKVERPVRVDDLSGKDIKTIVVGDYVGAAVDGRGRLYWWGACGKEDATLPPHLADQNPTKQYTSISCGSKFVAAISHDSKLFVWTANCGKGKQLPVYERIKKTSCGKSHLAMLTDKGEVYTWSYDNNCDVDFKNQYEVKKVKFNQICKDVVCGFSTIVCLSSSGDVWACGGNSKSWGLSGDDSEFTKVQKLTMERKIAKLTVAWGLAHDSYQSVYVAIATNGEKQVWYDSEGPSFPESSPTVDLFFKTVAPRDIMYTVLYPHPLQYCVKCVNCQSSYNIKYVTDQMQKKLDVVSDLIMEMVQDLNTARAGKNVLLEDRKIEDTVNKLNAINSLMNNTSTVATQTEILQDT